MGFYFKKRGINLRRRKRPDSTAVRQLTGRDLLSQQPAQLKSQIPLEDKNMASKPTDTSRLRLWMEAALIIVANPDLPIPKVADLLDITAEELTAIVTSALGKKLLRMYEEDPPACLKNFKLDDE